MTELLWKGFIIGFFIAMPVGPIGILCIRRTLAYGRISGFVSGLGAATADGCYSLIAGLGLTAAIDVLVSLTAQLKLFGGFFLCYLAYKIFTSPVADQSVSAERSGFISDYLSTLLLTVTNPLTILSFTAIFAGLGLGVDGVYRSAIALVGGVVTGSALWWLILSGIAGYFRDQLDYQKMIWVNKTSGLIMFTFALYAIFSW